MHALVSGKFVQAKSNGKYVRGSFLDGSSVVGFYVDSQQDPQLADRVLKLGQLDDFRAEADVYANKSRQDGTAYLSVRLSKLLPKAG